MLNFILKILVLAVSYSALRNRESAYELWGLITEGARLAVKDFTIAALFVRDFNLDSVLAERGYEGEPELIFSYTDDSEAFTDDQNDDIELAEDVIAEAEAHF
jgi:hypothetical protein